MPLLIASLAAIGGAGWLLGDGAKRAGEGAEKTGNGFLKLAVAAVAGYWLWVKVLKGKF